MRRYLLERGYKSTGLSNGDFEVCNAPDKGDDLNKTMFIGIINVSKKRKRRIPCIVRLQALNSCPLNGTQFFDMSCGAFVVESDTTITNGEGNGFVERGVLEQPQLPKQMVEGRPQVITDVSNEQRNIGGYIFDLFKPEDTLSCLSVLYNLVDNLIGLTLLYPLNQVINDFEMILCSAEFEERSIKRMHSKTIQRNEYIV